MIRGFDTSGHQSDSKLDLPAAYAAGERFHIVKVSEGKGYRFKGARARLEASRKAGFLVGEYHFARPDKCTPEEGLKNWLRSTCWQDGDLPPWVDAEKGLKTNGRPAKRAEANRNVRHLIHLGKGMLEHTGLKPVLYLTLPAWQWYFRKADPALIAELSELFDLCFADYVRKWARISGDIRLTEKFNHKDLARLRKDGMTSKRVCWQWTGKGKADWYKGSIDRCLMDERYYYMHRHGICLPEETA